MGRQSKSAQQAATNAPTPSMLVSRPTPSGPLKVGLGPMLLKKKLVMVDAL
jgi:hypothetical protein